VVQKCGQRQLQSLMGAHFSGAQCGFKAIRVVAEGKIHYFIGGSMTQGETGSDAAARISEWVAANFQAETIGGATVYDLS
jgi:hypothetical protein